ncbi:MAG: hypothetical protein ACI9R3_002750 [Verrucomicrobiales bacterium]|jgi:hypothetical protein
MQRAHQLVIAIALGCVWTSCQNPALGQVDQELRQAVVNLSDDSYANRERATRILWESGDRPLVEEIVQHGATAEAKSRAAQVLSAYQWGIVPGVADAARKQIEQFRNGSVTARHEALSQLMYAGYLQDAARCLIKVKDASRRETLNQHLRALMQSVIPRELAQNRRAVIEEFLTILAARLPDYRQDLKALGFQDVAARREEIELSETATQFLLEWNLSIQSGQALERLRQSQSLNRKANLFAFLVDQQRIADAIDLLRIAVKADDTVPAQQVLRTYLLRETGKAKVQHFSRNALNLPADSGYQPTGIAMTEGFRQAISFCHAYGIKDLVVEAATQLSTKLRTSSPAALPVFCTWSARYPELRDLAIRSAVAAHEAGISAEFSYGPLSDSFSLRRRWFGRFIPPVEKRMLLANSARNSGWSSLRNIIDATQATDLPAVARGQLAMAEGNWKQAAAIFSQRTEVAITLEEGAAMAYLAAFSYQHAENPGMATRWRTIAEAIPLADDAARAALADTMQQYGDHSGALQNRKQFISLYQGRANRDPQLLMHTLRLTARSLNLSSSDDLAFAPRVIERSASRTGEIAQDAVFFHRFQMAKAIAAKKWNIAAAELRSAHGCAPGSLKVFEQVAHHQQECPAEFLRAAKLYLAATQSLWKDAADAFPENVVLRRYLERSKRVLTD